jgi:hypothetical protein
LRSCPDDGSFEAAGQLQAFCDGQGWRSCFSGGLAVQRWGEPRVTLDVDLTVLAGYGGEGPFIDALRAAYSPRMEDAGEFARRHRVLLRSTASGVGIDVSIRVALAGYPGRRGLIHQDPAILSTLARLRGLAAAPR